jgi:hypothetical protein
VPRIRVVIYVSEVIEQGIIYPFGTWENEEPFFQIQQDYIKSFLIQESI